MRINRYVAACSGMSRRAADEAIAVGRVTVNGVKPPLNQNVSDGDLVALDGNKLRPQRKQTILFHKPPGYVTSRDGQGSKTIYDVLPPDLQHLKPAGRLDKDSSGLLLLTNDGDLAQQLTHPRFHKVKVYEVTLSANLTPLHRQMISESGILLDDGPSKLALQRLADGDKSWRVIMHEGRNRQIRRTFTALGYVVTRLHRTQFGEQLLGELPEGAYRDLDMR